MVVQKTLDNLKERPKEDKQAVALGAAGTVVLILLIGWAFLFFRSLGTQNNMIQQDDTYTNIVDTGSTPVQQTGVRYNTNGADQFGAPPETSPQ